MAHDAQFSIRFVRDIVYFAASRGADAESLCRRADFAVERLAMTDESIGGEAMERVWEAAIAETGDEHFGLHLGEASQPAVMGLLGFAMLSCTKMDEALDKLVRYWNLMSNATEIGWWRTEKNIALGMWVVELPGNFLTRNRQPVESSLSAAMALVRALAGRELPVVSVGSQYPAPARTDEYRRIFGRMPRFGSEDNWVMFPPEVLEWPVLHANPALLAAFEQQIEQRLAATPRTTRECVRVELAKGLRGELPDLGFVAKRLHASQRALQRDLHREGTTFREVLDELRRDLAEEYLRDARHSIADVSFLLGFSEPSVFHRSCKRWFGVTPKEFRQGGPQQQRTE